MDQRIHVNVDQACVTQHAGNAPADIQIHSFRFGVAIQNLSQPVPCLQWRIAHMCYPVSFVQGNDTSGPHQSRHLGNNLLRLGYIDQNQAGRGEIERFSWQSCIGGVPLPNLHVVYPSQRKKFSSELDSMIAQFHANHRASRTDPTGKQFEATLRTTADLDYSGSLCQPNLIEESGRFLSEFLGLLLQASLLNGTVAQKVLVRVCHRRLA